MNSKDSIIQYLEELGLSEIESRLYITLLETGPIKVRELAKLVNIKRTTTYFYIDQLVDKGLIIKIVKGAQKQIAANQPDESLQYLVEEKKKSIDALQKELPDVLNKIQTSLPSPLDTSEAEIKYYKGKNGVKKIYEEALKSKELRTYVNLSEIANVFPENANLFSEAFKNNPYLIIYELVEKSPVSQQLTTLFAKSAKTQVGNKSYFYKIISSDVKISSANILIFDGKVGIINLRDKISGVILYNLDYHNISKKLFNFVWKMLPAENL